MNKKNIKDLLKAAVKSCVKFYQNIKFFFLRASQPIKKNLFFSTKLISLFFVLKILRNVKKINAEYIKIKTKQTLKTLFDSFNKSKAVTIFLASSLTYMWFIFLINHYVLSLCIFVLGVCWMYFNNFRN